MPEVQKVPVGPPVLCQLMHPASGGSRTRLRLISFVLFTSVHSGIVSCSLRYPRKDGFGHHLCHPAGPGTGIKDKELIRSMSCWSWEENATGSSPTGRVFRSPLRLLTGQSLRCGISFCTTWFYIPTRSNRRKTEAVTFPGLRNCLIESNFN